MELTKKQLLLFILIQWLIIGALAFHYTKVLRVTEEYVAQEQLLNELLLDHTQVQSNQIEDLLEIQDHLMLDMAEEWNFSPAIATSYAPFDNQSGRCAADNANVVTSLGWKPNSNIIAVDPERIPYGSFVIVFMMDGTYRTGVAGDTGAALRSSEELAIDVYADTYEEALTFGRREVVVFWK